MIEVTHKYTEEELIAQREKYTNEQRALKNMEKEKKASAKRFTENIKAKNLEQDELLENIMNGHEQRFVQAQPTPNYKTKRMEYYATEGRMAGELVYDRRMTPDERQLELNVEDKLRKVGT